MINHTLAMFEETVIDDTWPTAAIVIFAVVFVGLVIFAVTKFTKQKSGGTKL